MSIVLIIAKISLVVTNSEGSASWRDGLPGTFGQRSPVVVPRGAKVPGDPEAVVQCSFLEDVHVGSGQHNHTSVRCVCCRKNS